MSAVRLSLALLLLAPLAAAAPLEIVSSGRAQVRLETDGSERARFAADLLQRHVVLMAGAALPETGDLPPLRLEADDTPGYRIADRTIRGGDLVRAVVDLLEGWGCRFDADPPRVPARADLPLEPRAWKPERELWWEGAAYEPTVFATGLAETGLDAYAGESSGPGYPVRVASESFDDFLPPAEHFAEHPEWFALRNGARAPRGNFALTNPDARNAYVRAVGRWIAAHPEVAVLGIWPEVTTVWCEESEALGHAESYALLWRDVARRFPDRRFEILATGLTLRPPEGSVPDNVEVRLRPGRDASALQGVAGQEIEAVVQAWEARGARVLLEIDAAPESWCGLPWPIDGAIRANARRFRAAVLRNGSPAHARLWRDPASAVATDPERRGLLERARRVRSWGDPRDAADLFVDEALGVAFEVGALERLHRIAMDEQGGIEERRAAAVDAYLGYRQLLRVLPPAAAASYRRYRARDFRRMQEELLPDGVSHEVGPARVRETFDGLTVETDLLRLVVDRRTASVVSLRRRGAAGWSDDLAGDAGACFVAVGLDGTRPALRGDVEVEAPEPDTVVVHLGGSRLELRGGSGKMRQVAGRPGGVAVACRWSGPVFDHWVCPAYAREGRWREPAVFQLPAGTLFYCRAGARGPGLAARLPDGGLVRLTGGDEPMLLATAQGEEIAVEWIVFTDAGELGR